MDEIKRNSRPKRQFPFDCLDFNATTLQNGLASILQYVDSKIRNPGDLTLEAALAKISGMARDTMFVADEELAATPKDDLGDAISRSVRDDKDNAHS